jgi:hypothetical protein
LSKSFEAEISKTCPQQHLLGHETYKNNDASSLRKAVEHVMQQHFHTIFFPGYFSDQDTLEGAIQEAILGRSHGPASDITILGGDGLDDFINPNHNTFSTIYSTVYSYPLENDVPSNFLFFLSCT